MPDQRCLEHAVPLKTLVNRRRKSSSVGNTMATPARRLGARSDDDTAGAAAGETDQSVSDL